MELFGKPKKHLQPPKKIDEHQPPEKGIEEEDYRSADPMSLLRELFKYSKCFTQTPRKLLSEIVRRVDSSYNLVDLETIRGEAAIIAVTDQTEDKKALKIARPELNLSHVVVEDDIRDYESAGDEDEDEEEQDIRDENGGDKDRETKKVTSFNLFKERFCRGAALEKRIYYEIKRAKIDIFNVPEVKKISTDPFLYLEMNWIEGIQILRRLKEKNDMLLSLEKFCDLLDAVGFIHEQKIIHRDLKGENIMIGRENGRDVLFIVDWTSGKPLGSKINNLTRIGEGIGTMPYAGEDFIDRKSAKANEQSDIFALGFVLWEFWRCKPIPKTLAVEEFENKSKLQEYIDERRNGLPKSLRSVFLNATNLDKSYRYKSIGDFKSDMIKAIEKISKMSKDEIEQDERDEQDIQEPAHQAETPIILLSIDDMKICENSNSCPITLPCREFQLCKKTLLAMQEAKKEGVI